MYAHAQFFGIDVVMSQIQAMAEDVQPLLAEVRDSGLLKEVESLTRSLTQASEDLRCSLPFSSVHFLFWHTCHITRSQFGEKNCNSHSIKEKVINVRKKEIDIPDFV